MRLDSYRDVDRAFDRLYPLCRSILGQGYRDSLSILCDYVPFKTETYPSGARVLGWRVPQEWVIQDAFIEDEHGNRFADFAASSLSMVNYSDAVDEYLSLSELRKHLYTLPALPKAVPYTTSYYKKRWGFCMSAEYADSLTEGCYHAVIKSSFIDGRLVIGQAVLPGQSKREILISSYLCHPSMANNELSGPLVQAMLYQRLSSWERRYYTYRFVINPETIGSLAYLSAHGEDLKQNLQAGLVLTCLGGSDHELRLKRSRLDHAPFDELCARSRSAEAAEQGLRPVRTEQFVPHDGSDERQYCSPGFNLPVSQIARLVYGTYPEYHTSLDNKDLMGIDAVMDSADQVERLLKLMDREVFYVNLHPYGEPKLGDFNLYPSLNSHGQRSDRR